MSRFLKASFALPLAVLMTGCVVHDNNNSPEPNWWPTFLLRQDTVAPSGGKVNVNVDPKGWPDDFRGPRVNAGTLGIMAAASAGAPVWFAPETFYNASAWYQPTPYSVLNGGAQAGAPYPQQDTPTLYPGRGQATLEAGNASLYPPRGIINTTPQQNPTLYPHGAAGPAGYRGR